MQEGKHWSSGSVRLRTAYWSRYVCWVPISFYIDDDGEMIVRAAVEVKIILN